MTVFKSPRTNRTYQELCNKLASLRAQKRSIAGKLSQGAGDMELIYQRELKKTDEAIEKAKEQCAQLLEANGKGYLVAAL